MSNDFIKALGMGNDPIFDLIKEWMAESREATNKLEQEHRAKFAELAIPDKIGWGGFDYSEHTIYHMEGPTSQEDVWEFFGQTDPSVTFKAQVAMEGAGKREESEHYGLAEIEEMLGRKKNFSHADEVAWLCESADAIRTLVAAHGGAIADVPLELMNAQEKDAREQKAALWGDMMEMLDGYRPPLHYVEVHLNADGFRSLARLEIVEAIQLVGCISTKQAQRDQEQREEFNRLLESNRKFEVDEPARPEGQTARPAKPDGSTL